MTIKELQKENDALRAKLLERILRDHESVNTSMQVWRGVHQKLMAGLHHTVSNSADVQRMVVYLGNLLIRKEVITAKDLGAIYMEDIKLKGGVSWFDKALENNALPPKEK